MSKEINYMISKKCNDIFLKSIEDYHKHDNIDVPVDNPYPENSLENLFYLKNWIDTVQWHLEDIIRDPKINAEYALQIKRRIDHLNQKRTDIVEDIDSWFWRQFSEVKSLPDATINTESPAWAIDRLSILALKIYHMQIETNRADATEEHKKASAQKLNILLSQRDDLSAAIDQLLNDIKHGRKYMKVYRQMKMYNDETLNPILYQQKNKSF
jgi:chromosome segregation ATPase